MQTFSAGQKLVLRQLCQRRVGQVQKLGKGRLFFADVQETSDQLLLIQRALNYIVGSGTIFLDRDPDRFS